jgi:hypothetical protein
MSVDLTGIGAYPGRNPTIQTFDISSVRWHPRSRVITLTYDELVKYYGHGVSAEVFTVKGKHHTISFVYIIDLDRSPLKGYLYRQMPDDRIPPQYRDIELWYFIYNKSEIESL